MELMIKTKVEVEGHEVRLGLDPHGQCWIVGRDLAALIGRRYAHIPRKMHGKLDDGTILASFEILRHWQTTGKRTSGTTQLGTLVLNKAVPEMCERLYGPTRIKRMVIDQLLAGGAPTLPDLLRCLPGDHHVYSTLVRQAFGAMQIQRDAGPFAPHHTTVEAGWFEVDMSAVVTVGPQGVAAILHLLAIRFEVAS